MAQQRWETKLLPLRYRRGASLDSIWQPRIDKLCADGWELVGATALPLTMNLPGDYPDTTGKLAEMGVSTPRPVVEFGEVLFVFKRPLDMKE